MESGAILGISSSVTALVLMGWLIARFFAGPITWRSVIAYSVALVLAAMSVCGANFLLAMGANFIDSSHGFMSVGLPIAICLAGGLVSLSAFIFAVLKTESQKNSQITARAQEDAS